MNKKSKESLIFIYTTYPDLGTAKEICQLLLEANLIACANLLPQMHSVYRWDNKLEESQEVVGILKTRRSLFEACREAIEKKHPYSTPCILSVDIENANETYGNWLLAETKTIL